MSVRDRLVERACRLAELRRIAAIAQTTDKR